MKTRYKLIGGAAACLLAATVSKADIIYNWVPFSGNATTTIGTLDVNSSGVVVSLEYYETGTLGTLTLDYNAGLNNATWNPTPPPSFPVNGVKLLGDGDVVLDGYLYDIATGDQITFTPDHLTPFGTEQNVANLYSTQGDWSPVPEPTTMIAGAFLLFPMGASTLRALRKNRAA